jgi:hypothetical protein
MNLYNGTRKIKQKIQSYNISFIVFKEGQVGRRVKYIRENFTIHTNECYPKVAKSHIVFNKSYCIAYFVLQRSIQYFLSILLVNPEWHPSPNIEQQTRINAII